MGFRLKKTVVMVGMMGAGKTAIGSALARELDVPFRDSDDEIVAASNMTIPEIFARDGEAFFREKEAQVIRRLMSGPPGVLSTGGGAYLAERNRRLIAETGVAVWLRAELDLLWDRVRHKDTRPLLRTGDPYGTLAGLLEAPDPGLCRGRACGGCRSGDFDRRDGGARDRAAADAARCAGEERRMTETVRVALGARSYDVRIGPGLIGRAGEEIAPLLARPRVAILTDARVAELHLAPFEAALAKAGIKSSALALPPGEATKGWPEFSRAVEWLLAERIERRDVVVALGGGVIGDLAGFAAAVLRRGVRFVQVPTTLLAQVDSSVGGKTGINAPQGKNLIGAFHQPSLVLADTDVLGTLPPRDFLAGYGEVVKYGLLGDAAFFEWLETEGPGIAAGDEAARVRAVRRSVEMKAEIVARDETEAGDRALLNLGHTFCHALEAATGYSDRLLHGEGVAVGCALAFDLSARLGLCAQEDPSRVRAHLKAMGTKTDLADIPGDLPGADGLLDLMAQDKKVVDGRLRFILARGIGEAFVADDVPPDAVRTVLEEALAAR